MSVASTSSDFTMPLRDYQGHHAILAEALVSSGRPLSSVIHCHAWQTASVHVLLLLFTQCCRVMTNCVLQLHSVGSL